MAVNPVTNKIYVANSGEQRHGDRRGDQCDDCRERGTNPLVVAVNPVTNKIYVPNQGIGI